MDDIACDLPSDLFKAGVGMAMLLAGLSEKRADEPLTDREIDLIIDAKARWTAAIKALRTRQADGAVFVPQSSAPPLTPLDSNTDPLGEWLRRNGCKPAVPDPE